MIGEAEASRYEGNELPLGLLFGKEGEVALATGGVCKCQMKDMDE